MPQAKKPTRNRRRRTASRRSETGIEQLVIAGISGFVPKETTRADFLTAIRTVASNTEFPKKSKAPKNGSAPLTQRQRQIFGLISKGVSRKNIARKLHITTSTVATHVQSILRKLMDSP